MGHMKIWVLLAVLWFDASRGYKILVVSPIPSGSHVLLGDACVDTLLDAGHEVTYITAIPKNKARPKFAEIDVSAYATNFPINVINLTLYLSNQALVENPLFFLDKASFYSVELIKHPAVHELMVKGEFDLIIAEWMFSEIYAGLSAVFDCPFIWFSSMQPHTMLLQLVDDTPNPSYSTDFVSNHIAPLAFFDRVLELLIRVSIIVYREYYVFTAEKYDFEKLYAPHMARSGKILPSYEDVRYNASLVLSNSHLSLGQATHMPQNYISIGGFHIKPESQILSEDLKRIMDKAKYGVIYFSMGSILQSKDFPQQMILEILDMFASLNQTVLWKYEEEIPNLPSNVHVLKWASQQGILAHPNCKVFITHGGLLSLHETTNFGVPIIGIPTFADQFVNILRAVKNGYAMQISLSYNLVKDLKVALEEVLNDPRYKQKAKELSFLYRNRPVEPRKEMMHWVEHVIKTQGYLQSRSPALQVSFYQKLYLDFIAVIVVIIIVLKRLFKWILYKVLSRWTDTKKLEEKKNI